MAQGAAFCSQDSCVSLFGAVWETGILDFRPHARILEIGCAEGDWQTPMLAARPDLLITGIDWRECSRPGEVIRGNVLTYNWPKETFDAIVCVSSIEHVGLGHYEQDPLDVDGDTHALERAMRWLKPGGWVYADVPYGTEYKVVGTSHRVYDDSAIASRLIVPGLTERARWFSTWRDDDHRLHTAPQPDPPDWSRFWYVALVAQKATP